MAIHIVYREAKKFENRQEAGQLLSKELEYLAGKQVVVLGIPRGGVIVAAQVSHFLNAELDVVLSRKIGAPTNPEFAIGAISEDGREFIDESAAYQTGADKPYIQRVKARQLAEIANRKSLYRKVCPKAEVKQKTVIVIDDGLATGATMQAALWSVRQEKPERIIAAIPVASRESLEKIAKYADDILCLSLPDYFSAVGQFYAEFPEVSDGEVSEILGKVHRINMI